MRPFLRLFLGLAAALAWLIAACASREDPIGAPGDDAGDDASSRGGSAGAVLGSALPDPSASDDAATTGPPIVDGVSATTGPPMDAGDTPDGAGSGGTDGAATPSASMPPFDAGEGGICPGPLSPGDLVIDELMIESVAGSGDHGEWLEVRSTLPCAFDLRGLHGDAPSGNKVRTFTVADDLWVPAGGTLVVADSTNATINHSLSGPLVAWSGQPGDVLRNKGATVTLRSNGLVIDALTYPSLPLIAGASLAFPNDCPAERRGDWTAWQSSTSSFYAGLYGTPNAPNSDVQCP